MRARIGALAAPILLLILAACGSNGDGDGAQTPASDTPDATTTVKVADSELGRILVDESGRALYAFTKDKAQSSNCDEKCIAVWPALTSTETVAGEGADTALIGHTDPAEGPQQATYNQWPLYYYVGDMVAGDVNGQGIDDEWFVLGPDGKLIKKTE
jgi:predicted lipoprotein with Yx(FWY)xxD motif